MKAIRAIGAAALVGILIASLLYVTGGIDLWTTKSVSLLLTVAWFVAALLPRHAKPNAA